MHGKGQHQVSDIHHYLPVFYTRRWAGSDKRVCTFTKPYKSIVKPRRLHPPATGYVRGLYEMRGLTEELRDQFEKLFLKPADSRAADALAKLEETEGKSWDPKSRTAWSGFILTLMLRMPDDVANLKLETERQLRAIDPKLVAEYRKLKVENDPDTFAEWLEKNDPHLFANAAFRVLKKLMDHSKIGQDLNNLHWFVIPTPKSRFDLFTSDSPLLRSFYFGNPDARLLLPLGPRRLFVAARDPKVGEALMRKRDDDLVVMVNKVVVGSARGLVIATDDSQFEYVQRRMGMDPIVRLMDHYANKGEENQELLSATEN